METRPLKTGMPRAFPLDWCPSHEPALPSGTLLMLAFLTSLSAALTPARPWRRWLPSECRLCRSAIAPRTRTAPVGLDGNGALLRLLDYGVLCPACLQRFWLPSLVQSRCWQCALPLGPSLQSLSAARRCGHCLTLAPPAPFDRIVACVDYEYPWDQILADYKLHQHPGLAPFIAACMAHNPAVAAVLQGADVILPVPLHASRLAQRGFNQTTLIARALLRQLPTGARPTLPQLHFQALVRSRATLPQRQLSASARRRNVQSAFVLDPDSHAALRNKHLVLLDDILTTGASLTSCAHALLPLRPASLCAVVMARARAHGGLIVSGNAAALSSAMHRRAW